MWGKAWRACGEVGLAKGKGVGGDEDGGSVEVVLDAQGVDVVGKGRGQVGLPGDMRVNECESGCIHGKIGGGSGKGRKRRGRSGSVGFMLRNADIGCGIRIERAIERGRTWLESLTRAREVVKKGGQRGGEGHAGAGESDEFGGKDTQAGLVAEETVDNQEKMRRAAACEEQTSGRNNAHVLGGLGEGRLKAAEVANAARFGKKAKHLVDVHIIDGEEALRGAV